MIFMVLAPVAQISSSSFSSAIPVHIGVFMAGGLGNLLHAVLTHPVHMGKRRALSAKKTFPRISPAPWRKDSADVPHLNQK